MKRETYGFQGFCGYISRQDSNGSLHLAAYCGPHEEGPWRPLVLGDHHVYRGDATQLEMIEKVMDGGLPDMVFCDPPYDLAYVASDSCKPAELSEPNMSIDSTN